LLSLKNASVPSPGGKKADNRKAILTHATFNISGVICWKAATIFALREINGSRTLRISDFVLHEPL
jgi:hypothetical protein